MRTQYVADDEQRLVNDALRAIALLAHFQMQKMIEAYRAAKPPRAPACVEPIRAVAFQRRPVIP